MMIAERIQALIHRMEVGGARRTNYVALVVAVFSLVVWYDLQCYHGFNSAEAMDAAQVARNVAEGNGFSTDYIRPFSIYLLQKHGHPWPPPASLETNLDLRFPDLANAPLYPLILAGFWKVHEPDWNIDERVLPWWKGGKFWSDGHFQRYAPEFFIALVNQLLLVAVVLLTFRITRTIFDAPAAWLAAILVMGSDVLWKFSVSGLPTMLLLVIFLGIVWCLTAFERLVAAGSSDLRRQFTMAVLAGLLAGLGMLTRYSFGWVIVPVFVYFAAFGGTRRIGLAVTTFLVFAVLVLPWILRNVVVSGTLFGTAGYAVTEGTFTFPGTRLMQSLHPDMSAVYWIRPYWVKLFVNARDILQDEVPRIGGGWMAILFFAGLLLGLRNDMARRLRYFTMLCLGVFIVISAMGRTDISRATPVVNGENLLVLLMPLVVIFGVAFFLTLLNQMNTPSLQVRYGVVAAIVALACQPFVMSLFPPRVPPVAYPPYYPPEVQKFASWMRPDELIMSDMPWAVAWYGGRQCTLTTINSQYEFFEFYDYVRPVNALYLTLGTLDEKLFTECLQGAVDSWGNFVFKTVATSQIPPKFPLKSVPTGMISGVFFTDKQRW